MCRKLCAPLQRLMDMMKILQNFIILAFLSSPLSAMQAFTCEDLNMAIKLSSVQQVLTVTALLRDKCVDKDGNNPLHTWAAHSGSVEVFYIIAIEYFNDIDTPNNDNYTPFMLAAENERPTAMELIFTYAAERKKTIDVNAQSKEGLTALLLAVYNEDQASVELLLYQLDADPTLKAIDGSSVMHLAATQDNAILIEIMLSQKVDINVTDSRERTPFYLAVKNKSMVAIYYLAKKGADINKGDYRGNTPLHLATIMGDSLLKNILLSLGADPNQKNLSDMTAAQLNEPGSGHRAAISPFLREELRASMY